MVFTNLLCSIYFEVLLTEQKLCVPVEISRKCVVVVCIKSGGRFIVYRICNMNIIALHSCEGLFFIHFKSIQF